MEEIKVLIQIWSDDIKANWKLLKIGNTLFQREREREDGRAVPPEDKEAAAAAASKGVQCLKKWCIGQ